MKGKNARKRVRRFQSEQLELKSKLDGLKMSSFSDPKTAAVYEQLRCQTCRRWAYEFRMLIRHRSGGRKIAETVGGYAEIARDHHLDVDQILRNVIDEAAWHTANSLNPRRTIELFVRNFDGESATYARESVMTAMARLSYQRRPLSAIAISR